MIQHLNKVFTLAKSQLNFFKEKYLFENALVDTKSEAKNIKMELKQK